MKLLKTLTLGTVFLFGLTAMPSCSIDAVNKKEIYQVQQAQTDCSDDFNRCNVQFPDSFEKFDFCMRQNGC